MEIDWSLVEKGINCLLSGYPRFKHVWCDLAQDARLAVLGAAEKWDPKLSGEATWTDRNMRWCISNKTKRAYHRRESCGVGVGLHESYPPDQEESVAASEIRAAIDSLDDFGRDLVHAVYWNGQTVQDFGSDLGWKRSKASRAHMRVLGELREHLGNRKGFVK